MDGSIRKMQINRLVYKDRYKEQIENILIVHNKKTNKRNDSIKSKKKRYAIFYKYNQDKKKDRYRRIKE